MQVSRHANCTKPYLKRKANTEAKLPEQYLYHRSFYLDDFTPIKVLCKSHGFFNETPNNLIKGKICPSCELHKEKKANWIYKGIKYNKRTFIAQARLLNGHKYSYYDGSFKGFHRKIKVFCPTHGYFTATPHHHLSPKALCPHCRGMRKDNK